MSCVLYYISIIWVTALYTDKITTDCYFMSHLVPVWDQVIRTYDDMFHMQIGTTIELIKQVYWFPKVIEYVKSYIRNCLKCIIFSPKEGNREGLLNLFDKGNKPF